MNKDKVMAKIRKTSAVSGVSINTLLLFYFFEQFLNKIALSSYNSDLILKGGFLLSSMMGIESRTTTDLDISLRNRNLEKDTLYKIISEILEVQTDNQPDFEIQSIEPIKVQDQYPGFKVSLLGKLENIRQPFSVDIATGDPITPGAIEYPYIYLSLTEMHRFICCHIIWRQLLPKNFRLLFQGKLTIAEVKIFTTYSQFSS